MGLELLLLTLLLPSRTRNVGHYEWTPLPTSCGNSNCCCCLGWGSGIRNWSLCMYLSRLNLSRLAANILPIKVPYMILGEVICCIGTGLLTTISLGSPAAMWVSYLVITGLGLGIAMQLPYTAVQVVLRYALGTLSASKHMILIPNSEADVPVGNGALCP